MVQNDRFMEKGNSSKLAYNQDLVFGTRAVLESIRSGKDIDKLMIQKGLNNPLIRELTDEAKKFNVPINIVPFEKLNRITRKNHQGAICFISSVIYASLDNIITRSYEQGKNPFILILDRVTDVRNFGAIARTAEVAGMDAIVIPSRGSASINSDAMKTSAGGLNYIPICREPNLKLTIKNLQDNGIQVVACTEKTDQEVYDLDLTPPTAIIMGSEEDGISPEYLKMVDQKGKFPVLGNIASLNVSVASALIIYEGVRQRKTNS